MLSYLHAFHAGNYADLQKHFALYATLRLMHNKATAITCIDTHAGSAVYDLTSEQARKTGEAAAGIERLWRTAGQQPLASWTDFLAAVADLNSGDTLQRYPGSPAWFQQCQRPGDELLAFELHSNETSRLQTWAKGKPVRVINADGFRGLLKALPPRNPRLLVLIDPPYEVKDDYLTAADTLLKAWQRCRHGVFLLWYPLLPAGLHKDMLARIQGGTMRKVLRSEVWLRDPPGRGMLGTGLLVVNPPWTLEEQLAQAINDLDHTGILPCHYQSDWLVPE
ncbi:MAG: 23S rRNA (adenine(2030)-N(6))-methyltransferase RlmJ [Marinobacter sp.]|nr:23S rRNA (adenine(2030)-N(6))-methyltransferase RlmJ [Marinobacter sp.]